MKLANKIISKFKDQRGVTALVVALALAMLLGFAALAIDVGYLYATKNELQNVADAAALAAAGKLGDIYSTTADLANYECDRTNIVPSAQAVVGAGKNSAGGKDIVIRDEDIYINNLKGAGTTRFDTNHYKLPKPDAVRVIARRDSIINTSISTFFARVFNINSVPVMADATAALTGPSKVITGGLPIPIGIGKKRFESEYCDKPIKFYPTTDIEACGGWHVYFDDKTLIKQDVLDGLLADPPTFTSPETEAGDVFYFKGGVDNAAYEKLKQLFDATKGINDFYDDEGEIKKWPIDGDLDSETWSTTVAIYNWDDCSNPNDHIEIVGFTKIRIYEICTASSDPLIKITGGEIYPPLSPLEYCTSGLKQIVAIIDCDFTEPSRGGGGNYGILGTIPGLVE